MTKKEKYIEFIVDDIISDTIFDQYVEGRCSTNAIKGYLTSIREGGYLQVPFQTKEDWHRIDVGIPDLFVYDNQESFVDYIVSRYGASEDDYTPIWDSLKNKMFKMIDG